MFVTIQINKQTAGTAVIKIGNKITAMILSQTEPLHPSLIRHVVVHQAILNANPRAQTGKKITDSNESAQ